MQGGTHGLWHFPPWKVAGIAALAEKIREVMHGVAELRCKSDGCALRQSLLICLELKPYELKR